MTGDKKVWERATRRVLDLAGWGAASQPRGCEARGAPGAESTFGLSRHTNAFLRNRCDELTKEVSTEVSKRDFGPKRPGI